MRPSTRDRATEGSDATIMLSVRDERLPRPEKLMKQIARVSGGRAWFSDDLSRWMRCLRTCSRPQNQYLLAYPAPDSRRNDQWHTIRVEVAGGKYEVRARQGYRLERD